MRLTLDKSVKTITNAIYLSIELSTKKSKMPRKRGPFWIEECRNFLHKIWQTQRYLILNKTADIFNLNTGAISETNKPDLCKIVKTTKQKYFKKLKNILNYRNIF